jgi:PilZ domain
MGNRQFTRVNCNDGASIIYGGEVIFCNADNLSLRGFHLTTKHKMPLHVPVQVTIYHSNLTSIKINATVVRNEENGVGIEITNVTASSFVQLRKIIIDETHDPDTALAETYKMLRYIN